MLGLILTAIVQAANCQDQVGAKRVLEKLNEQYHRLKVIFIDSAYGCSGLPAWTKETFGWMLQTVIRPVGIKGFVILPKRWIVEHTFAWLARYRLHSKGYEKTTTSSEALTVRNHANV